MITILTNNSCIREKKYVLDIIFSEFLGVDHSIEIDEGLTEELVIIPAPSTQLTLLDIFFTKADVFFDLVGVGDQLDQSHKRHFSVVDGQFNAGLLHVFTTETPEYPRSVFFFQSFYQVACM